MPIIIFFTIICLLAIILIKVKREKNIEEEKQNKINQTTMNLIDKTTFKRAEINTSYIQKQLANDIEYYTLANYSLDSKLLPKMFLSFYNKTCENIIREQNLNINKKINDFKMEKVRVVKQDNSSMYSVTKLIVEGTFSINYIYTHPTIKKHIIKHFTQRFVFFNNQNNWELQDIELEKILNKNEEDL